MENAKQVKLNITKKLSRMSCDPTMPQSQHLKILYNDMIIKDETLRRQAYGFMIKFHIMINNKGHQKISKCKSQLSELSRSRVM